jgi:Putative collagen-binding domain of a collagenase
MLSRPYFIRIPDQSIIIGDTGRGSAHFSDTRDRSGSYMMIYLAEGQSVTVDMIQLSGISSNAWWYDPRTGNAARIEGSFPTNHQQRFVPPSQGPGNDWVLVLDDAARNFPAPGLAP